MTSPEDDGVLEPDRRGGRVAVACVVVAAIGAFFAVGVGRQAPEDRGTTIVICTLVVIALDVFMLAVWSQARISPIVVDALSIRWDRRSLAGFPAPPPVVLADVDHVVLSRYRFGTGNYHAWGNQLELVGSDGARLARWRMKQLFSVARLDEFLRHHGLRVEAH